MIASLTAAAPDTLLAMIGTVLIDTPLYSVLVVDRFSSMFILQIGSVVMKIAENPVMSRDPVGPVRRSPVEASHTSLAS